MWSPLPVLNCVRRIPYRFTYIGEIEERLVKSKKYGAIAQLGERIVRNDEVVSSILTSSTISILRTGLAFFAVPQ